MRGHKGFTLVELLNVIAIIAILSAIFLPVIKSVKGAAYRYNASLAMKGLGTTVDLYMADHDDTYPIAMSLDNNGFRAWFGYQLPDGSFDPTQGIITAYVKGKGGKDHTHQVKPFMGDMTGFGYNWGYIGSDYNISLDYWEWPNCYRPARGSELKKSTIVFTTTAFFSAPWLEGGDGAKYDFGFADPPKYWRGNPNVDFRHGEPPLVNPETRTVTPQGMALFLFSSGNIKVYTAKQLKDSMFEREEPAAY